MKIAWPDDTPCGEINGYLLKNIIWFAVNNGMDMDSIEVVELYKLTLELDKHLVGLG